VLAVAAHDVGQYVKYYDLGKKYVHNALFRAASADADGLEQEGRRLWGQDTRDGAPHSRQRGRALPGTRLRPAPRQPAVGDVVRRARTECIMDDHAGHYTHHRRIMYTVLL
jgi:hypothetical protein